MRKIALYIIFGLGLIFVISRIGKWTGYIQNFRVYSAENEPTLQEQDWVFGTNLMQPKRLDFISYRAQEGNADPYLKTHRLVGLPHDTLEIKDGIVYINGSNIDKNINLKQYYIVSFPELNQLQNQIENLEVDRNKLVKADSLLIILTDKQVKRSFKPKMPIFDHSDEDIERNFKQTWSQDQFGPLIIPKDKFFAMGDNRDISYDSRYLGLIDKSDITAVLFVE